MLSALRIEIESGILESLHALRRRMIDFSRIQSLFLISGWWQREEQSGVCLLGAMFQRHERFHLFALPSRKKVIVFGFIVNSDETLTRISESDIVIKCSQLHTYFSILSFILVPSDFPRVSLGSIVASVITSSWLLDWAQS
jgi:hypothetical protein